MRAVLLALALTSNGRVAARDPSPGTGREPDPIPRLGSHDAPHLYYQALYQRAAADDEGHTPRLTREQVLARATDELERIRRSRRDLTKTETRQELYERIISDWEGIEDTRVAVAALCLLRWVHDARRRAGRDEKWGRQRRHNAPDRRDRQRQVRDLDAQGLNAKQIARALGVPYGTVLRDLDRKR